MKRAEMILRLLMIYDINSAYQRLVGLRILIDAQEILSDVKQVYFLGEI
jgi:hypothetical protein